MQPQQIIEFALNHWMLVTAFVVISGILVYTFVVGEQGSVDPVGATDLINHKDAVVVDVRSAADYATGHIINAINIPAGGFANQIDKLKKYKEKPIIVNCRSGGQSQTACADLRKAGFAEVYNLKGGILAWQSANLPLTRKKR